MAATVEQVLRVAIDASVQRFLAHEDGLRSGGDAEDVHQARVACRRLRSDLRTFDAFVDPEWAESLRTELAWLGAELGAVRDHEVLLERLRAEIDRLPGSERDTAARVVQGLVADWETTRAAMSAALATPRYRALRTAMQDAATAPKCSEAASDPARKTLPPVVKRPWRKLAAAVAELGDDPADEQLHEIRIRAKRARYAAEAVAPLFGGQARKFAAAMTRVQEVLGEHQDAVVARQWLAKTAVEVSAIEAYAIGMLGAVEWEAARAARREFPGVWKQASRPGLRAWL